MRDTRPRSELERRRPVWVAMSDLWRDSDLNEGELEEIATIVRDSGYSEKEVERIFRFELAPFLGSNHLVVAGVWSGFDPHWVCIEARKRIGRRSLTARVCAWTRLTTRAARGPWRKVKQMAFDKA